MEKVLELNTNADIIEGASIGGVSLFTEAEVVRRTSQFRKSIDYNIKESVDRYLVLSLEFINHFITLKFSCESAEIHSLVASPGYCGGWKETFIPGQFRLSQLRAQLRFVPLNLEILNNNIPSFGEDCCS